MADVNADPANEQVRNLVDNFRKIGKKDDQALYQFFSTIPKTVISTFGEYLSKGLQSTEHPTEKITKDILLKDHQIHANNIQNPFLYDVIISGAGPVGLFLACELALAKCSVLILEKAENPHSPLKKLPFGMRGLSSLSVEALYRRGLLHELAVPQHFKSLFNNNSSQGGQAPPPQRRGGGHFAGIQLSPSNIDPSQWKNRLPSSTDTNMMAEMEQLETVLARRAEALGVEIKRGVGIADFHQTEDRVTVQCEGQSFQSKWLVGCDGSRSVVRKVGGFDFAGTEPEFTGYSVRMDLADPEKLSPARTMTPTGMYWPMMPGYIMILEFDGGKFHTGEALSLEHVQQVLRRVSNTDVTVTALHTVTTWTDRARQATTYRNGRVFLAGDAAHIHAPLGGQGLNLGLGDAMNLGWKLAATIHGKAPEGLLDTYFTERHPIGQQILDWSRAQVAIMRPGPHARALNAIIRNLLDTRDGATYITGRLCGIFTHYDIAGEHPLVGYSVPNFEFEDGAKIGELMHNGEGILLDFTGSASLKTLASEYGNQIKYISGRAKEQLGLSALLVRPDGIVAWASSDSEPKEESIRKAADGWFIQ